MYKILKSIEMCTLQAHVHTPRTRQNWVAHIPGTRKSGCAHFRIGCMHPRHRENWAVHNTGRPGACTQTTRPNWAMCIPSTHAHLSYKEK